MKKLLLCGVFLGILANVHGQSITFNNPSFEGPPASSVSPPSWTGCQGSPDTQPGWWGVTLPASHMSTYIGFVYWLSIPTSQESAAQILPTPLVAGTNYSVSMRLVNLDIYNGSWNGSCAVRIYGGSAICGTNQLLWDSGFFTNSTWQTYTANFTPTSGWTSLRFQVEAGSGTWPSVGIDNLLSAVVLPVTFSKFEAGLVDHKVLLNWETTKEDNAKSFVVQRSNDGLEFSDIQTLPATGNTEMFHSYRAEDSQLREGFLFYRLKVVDENGNESHSEIRKVFYAPENNGALLLDIHPNPVSVEAAIEIQSVSELSGSLQIYDMQGKQMLSREIELAEGLNTFTVPVEEWTPGVYFVHCKTADSATLKKLVVGE